MGYFDDGVRDYLDAIGSWRRRLYVEIHTVELLRKPPRRSARQDRLLEQARTQVRKQMRAAGRRAFRDGVSVELTIVAPDTLVAPSAPKSVKRYLDLLNGLAYADDRQVSHLIVRRFAGDHPYRQPNRPGTQDQSDRPAVYMVVMPLRLFIADYDRAFSAHALRSRYRALQREEELADDQRRDLDRLYEERDEDNAGDGIYGLPNQELVEQMRRFREQQIREIEMSQLLCQQPDRYDRPGPSPDRAWLRLGLGELPFSVRFGRYEIPGVIWLPALLTEKRTVGQESWTERVRQTLETHRTRWEPLLPDFFDRPVALDIAIFVTNASTHDIDNVAHVILQLFEELYCSDRRGTVVAYRVYRCVGSDPGVRVQLMTDQSLRALQNRIDDACSEVIAAGPVDRW